VPRSAFPFATAAVAFTAIVALWNFQWPARNGNVNAAWEIQRRQIVQNIFDTIVAHSDFHRLDVAPPADPSVPPAQRVHSVTPQVLFCCMGDFNPDMLHFLAIQHQVPMRHLFNSGSGDPDDFLYFFGQADFIFCAEPGTQLIAEFLPYAPIQQRLLDEARNRTEFEQIGKWTFMKSTHSLYLFKRKDFSGFTPISGLSEEIGPIAGYDGSLVRWGLGPATKLKITAERAGAYEVYWRCLSDFHHQVVTVKRDGQVIGVQEAKFQDPSANLQVFGESRFPVAFSAGEHELEFDYPQWHTDSKEPVAVVFQHLNIARKEP
jgi:hypothetical protein